MTLLVKLFAAADTKKICVCSRRILVCSLAFSVSLQNVYLNRQIQRESAKSTKINGQIDGFAFLSFFLPLRTC